MLFGLPKRDMGPARAERPTIRKEKWCRLYDSGTHLGERTYFAQEVHFDRSLSVVDYSVFESDLLAMVKIDSDGSMTYKYELTYHCPGDWASFHLLSEVGQPYQHLFESFKDRTEQFDFGGDYRDFYCPEFAGAIS